jgi:hypothetical protein
LVISLMSLQLMLDNQESNVQQPPSRQAQEIYGLPHVI